MSDLTSYALSVSSVTDAIGCSGLVGVSRPSLPMAATLDGLVVVRPAPTDQARQHLSLDLGYALRHEPGGGGESGLRQRPPHRLGSGGGSSGRTRAQRAPSTSQGVSTHGGLLARWPAGLVLGKGNVRVHFRLLRPWTESAGASPLPHRCRLSL